MRDRFRFFKNNLFTALGYGSFLLVVASLVVILGPMLGRGATAVFFNGTVEYRRMQLELFDRGDPEQIEEATRQTRHARQPVYELLDQFQQGLSVESKIEEVEDIYRTYSQNLRDQEVPIDRRLELRRSARELRRQLVAALETRDADEAIEHIENVLAEAGTAPYRDTMMQQMFEIAREYRQTVRIVDLSQREAYQESLEEIRSALNNLFGDPGSPLIYRRYGATRWDRARVYLDRLLWEEQWVEGEPGEPLVKKRTPRADRFEGTALAALFPMIQNNLEQMLRPRFTVYWQYFFDGSTEGHYFGGVWPEVLGTLLLTVLSIVFALPLGVIAAAYLVECASDTLVVVVLRTCINTLAGVPSIVFGLFGLAFFVLFLLPAFGMPEGSSILAGSLTLGVLVLPIIIRASEEAIRSVPHAYKEAALSLGAGRFRNFVTVTLPAALPGILTGVILSMGRAAGETAPILFTAAVAMGPLPGSIFEPTRALSYSAYDIAVGDRLAAEVPHKQYGMIMTLILLVLILNIAAILIRARISKKLRG